MTTMNIQLKQAIAAARAGKKPAARQLVEGVVKEEPENANAWLLLGTLAESDAEQVQYFNRVLAIDPDNLLAQQRLAKIGPLLEEEAAEWDAEISDAAEAQTDEDLDAHSPLEEEGETDEAKDELMATVISAVPASAVEQAMDELPTSESADEIEAPELLDPEESETEAEQPDTVIAFASELPGGAFEAETDEEAEADDEDELALAEETDVHDTVVADRRESAEGLEEKSVPEESEPKVRHIQPPTILSDASPFENQRSAMADTQPLELSEDLEEMPKFDSTETKAAPGRLGELPDLADIPDWLRDEGGYAEPGASLQPATSFKAAEQEDVQEVPEWLQDEPGDAWLQSQEEKETHAGEWTVVGQQDTLDETLAGVEPEEPAEEETSAGDSTDEFIFQRREENMGQVQTTGSKPRISTRSLEIILAALIVMALLVVAALAYVLVSG